MNFALAELKQDMIDVLDGLFEFLFKRMCDTPIPITDTSDIEKVQIR